MIVSKKHLIISILLGLVVEIVYGQKTFSPEDLYEIASKASVTIYTKASVGSGFFITDDIIVTNYHVIEGAQDARYFINSSQEELPILGFVALDKKNDLILLKTKHKSLSTLKLSSIPVKIGQSIYVLGSPKGLAATFSNGLVSGIRILSGKEMLQITAPISPGSSGGPVINSAGNIVGVSVSQLTNGQNLNFAIPSKYVTDLLAKATSYHSFLELFDLQTRAYFNKKYSEVIIADQVWMATNLNVDRFKNGDTITESKNAEEFESNTKKGIPSWIYRAEPRSDLLDFHKKDSLYGRFYNFPAISDKRGLAPAGWKIPEITDWANLLVSVGGERIAADAFSGGHHLKSVYGWTERNGDGKTNFSVLPVSNYNGFMTSSGENRDLSFGNSSMFFTKSIVEDGFFTVGFFAGTDETIFSLWPLNNTIGFSVRCLKE